jgi:hypothetical protein
LKPDETLKEKVTKLRDDCVADLEKISGLKVTEESKDRIDMSLRHKILAYNEVLELIDTN